MHLDGVVFRIQDGVYLCLLDPVIGKFTDGIPISSNEYDTLKNNQVSVVDVILKDGNLELNDLDVTKFVNDKALFEQTNIFYNIKDLMIYTIDDHTIEEVVKMGDFLDMVTDMVKQTKEDLNNTEKEN